MCVLHGRFSLQSCHVLSCRYHGLVTNAAFSFFIERSGSFGCCSAKSWLLLDRSLQIPSFEFSSSKGSIFVDMHDNHNSEQRIRTISNGKGKCCFSQAIPRSRIRVARCWRLRPCSSLIATEKRHRCRVHTSLQRGQISDPVNRRGNQ